MVNCFRGVPYKLCCTNYFKAANITHPDTKFGLRKFTQTPSEKRVRLASQNENLTAQCNPPNLTSAFWKKDYLLPLDSKSLSLYKLAVRPRQGNVINILPSNISARRSTHVLNSGFANDPEKSKSTSTQGRPSEEQLENAFQNLTEHLPKILVTPLPVDCYHSRIVLENNFRNKRTTGLLRYVSQLAVFRMVTFFKFAYVKVQILKITKHPEDGTIKVRWRVVGFPGMSVVFQFWKYNIFNLQKQCDDAPTWIDGFSIYYVGDDGKIFKHILDRMQPNDDVINAKPKSSVAPKVTLFVSLLDGHEKAETFASRDHKDYKSYL